jgi:amino acid adenylation domain-containing protein
VTALSRRLAALSPEKRALFDRMLAEQGLTEDAFPISVMQQGIWFLEQLRPGNPGYAIPAAARLRGPLDTAALRRAVAEIVRRHEILRTTFHLRDGRPVQVVHRDARVDVEPVDLGDLAGSGREVPDAALRTIVADSLREPFDITTGPLLRVRLLRAGPHDHVLAFAMHHLISDGWSVGVLLAELSALYAAFAAGQPSPLPELRIQYGDFAAWQQRWLSGSDLGASLGYWRDHLAGAPAALNLPTDRPRPAVQGFHGASVPFELPAAVMDRLTALGRERGATPYMVLLAVFHILLHRYSGQDDIVVGVPMANRGRAEVEPLIGFFVNTLPVRARLAGHPAFPEMLDRVRDACLGAYTHQAVPFEKVVEDLKTARDLSRPPVYQVSFSYQSDPLTTLSMAGLRLHRLPLSAEGARFDLELQSFAHPDGVTGWFEYDRDLFDESTMRRMAGHFRRLADLVVDQPTTPVGRLPLLDPPERNGIVATGTGPRRQWPGHGWIHQCIEEQARLRPDAEAVRFEGYSVSYAGLNRRANRVAHRLRRLGVAPGVRVGVAMHRGVELVVALLAVVKAGGAYVPLDPGYPPARLAAMLDDAAPRVLLTQGDLLDTLPPVPARTLTLDDPDEFVAEPDGDPGVELDGEDLAYVIYTSGSTGTPKGVMNVHAAIRNRLLWMQDQYRLDSSDRVLQKTPFSFDVSVWELFWPLMVGAALVVARPGGHRDSQYLVDTIRVESITTVHFVPSMLQIFLTEPELAGCTSLRRVICSGEALPRQAQAAFFAAHPTAQLHNLYGPTEAAVDVTFWACRRGGDDPRPVPIGYPIANTEMYIFDPYGEPVPAGVAGELHIGGRNLARGYLNQPDLTASRFVPDPFSARPGARLYATGDLARWRDDGAIEYLGRLDHQVKLRGFRIELGEIETVLAGHDRVREAIVTARGLSAGDVSAGDVRLVAYVVADGDPPATAELITHVRARLPEYMIPSAFVVLPALPLTPHGKVDLSALPAPRLERAGGARPFAAPRTELEKTIAGAWQQVLGIAQVGVDDNFFDLGGHSLLMAQLKVIIGTRLGREVSMVELFQHPTIGALAGHLSRPERDGDPLLAAWQRADHRRRSQIHRQQAAAQRANSRKR